MIPTDSAEAISRAAREVEIDPAELAAGTSRDGILAPVFVRIFREWTNAPEHAQYVHWGLTRQDVIDTGLMQRLKRQLEVF